MDTDTINNYATRFIQLDEEIKEKKQEKKDIEEKIKEYMEQNSYTDIKLTGANISFKKSERKTAVKSNDVIETFHEHLTNNVKTSDIAEDIMEDIREMLENKKEKKISSTLKIMK
jgi:signal recognition particle GTPase